MRRCPTNVSDLLPARRHGKCVSDRVGGFRTRTRCHTEKQPRLLRFAPELNHNSKAALPWPSFDITISQETKMHRSWIKLVHETSVSFEWHFDCEIHRSLPLFFVY